MVRSLGTLFAALAIVLGSAAAQTDNAVETRIGEVKTVTGLAFAERVGDDVQLDVGTELFAADRIVTGPDSSVGLTLVDDTVMSLGPNSELDLSVFEFDTTTYEGALDIAVNQGSLSIVSGRIAARDPDAVTVRTPTSILGVRGTEFLVEVGQPVSLPPLPQ